ncbi:Xaa-Pro peptidase family protein [Saccharibacillus sp. JS10]|uniref:M24 family metallopeptidase n=1 Tax=Saccharibacillus sp. JS10 TaxID=2950552 RepID=UPI00210EF8FA|nr:aminopeptidase P family protein [Saccharibacillus sp. JS10]MCQ4087879.1 M24 family metallopeptidase [Saccharibacillus sp. JS10]
MDREASGISKPTVSYTQVPPPDLKPATSPVDLTDDTMALHLEKVLQRMQTAGLDALAIYADREHGTNFGYLTGYEPRFEESVLVLHTDGKAVLTLGNESLRMAQYSRLAATTVHTPYFSLPNQPMENTRTLAELIGDAGIVPGLKVGLVGWKMFTSLLEDNGQLFDLPSFIVDAIKSVVGENGEVVNATGLFIHPHYGARVQMNANEIAHYEFGASQASDRIRRLLEQIEPGKTEMELAHELAVYGQPNNVQTICATGDRFTNAVVAPRNKEVKIGDKFSATLGYRGGLTSRSGYVVSDAKQLPSEVRDYLDAVAIPYYAAAATWYEQLEIGMTGGEMYEIIDSVLPKSKYHWHLNPGHLTAGEEWMSSPFTPDSNSPLQSGMLLQMDIIPAVPGYGGASAEDGVAIADENLRLELAKKYPEVWARMVERRLYMEQTLGIRLKPEVLPLSTMNGYLRPFLLNKKYALKIER